MSFEHLPEKARNSHLIRVLDRKLEQPPEADFDYRGELVRLAKQITADVTYINALFPEYTPHDSQYHLNRLFHVADIVIEAKRFEELNTAELFVLAASLYAHDWGMAVSEAERQAITSLITDKGKAKGGEHSFALLPDEAERLNSFAVSQGCTPREALASQALWRNYIRATHPDRSAARVRDFFIKAGGGVGDAIARVSRGHGVDIAELYEPTEFPTDFSVQGLNVNLRGLAVFVRLIDLLDIADDRTPFAIWKFVSPRDPKSAEEWAKHRALNPVTCPSYQSGRMILVDGSASDPDVWAALRDLERYVRQQVRECNDLLARSGDARFHLDIPTVEWRIATPGFTPIDLRFEFERDSMFRILSEEIYDGDVYVFLRELLQNSIDAIRLRRAVLEKEGVHMSGLVVFEVSHEADGSARVTCRDDGIGMNEHIIRDYLALAGRSYYSSDEFKHLGLGVDAIARFGVGILSCFMAGPSIELVTRRDPNVDATSIPLRVAIPAVEHQFRVYPGPKTTKVGTSVTVNVCGTRVRSAPAGWNEKLRVADYLAAVGGFSEFPVLVSDGGVLTLIISPDVDEDKARSSALTYVRAKQDDVTFQVRRTAQEFPWAKTFLAQDEEKARRALRVRWFDLQRELGFTNCSGRVACLLPRDEGLFSATGHSDQPGQKVATFYQAGHKLVDLIRWNQWRERQRTTELPRSINVHANRFASCNGILVADEGRTTRYEDLWMPEPAVWINFLRAKDIQLNVARQTVLRNMPGWQEEVIEALHYRVLDEEREILLGSSVDDRAARLGKLMSWYEIPPERIAGILPSTTWPIIRVVSADRIEIVQSGDWSSQSWPVLPDHITYRAKASFVRKRHGANEYLAPILDRWRGAPSLLGHDRPAYVDYVSSLSSFSGWVAATTRPVRRIQFVRGPRNESTDVLAQVVRFPLSSDTPSSIDEITRGAIDNPGMLTAEDWSILAASKECLSYHLRPSTGWFLPPFEDYFACGCAAWNANHPVVQMIVRFSIVARSMEGSSQVSAVTLGRARDCLSAFVDSIVGRWYSVETTNERLQSCIAAFDATGVACWPETLDAPGEESFIPGTFEYTPNGRMALLDDVDYDEWDRGHGAFGQLIY